MEQAGGESVRVLVPRLMNYSTTITPQNENTGNSRDMVPEEFARGDRKAFEGYKLKERGEFMRQVRQDSQAMKDAEMDELLGVANIAGINIRDQSTRLNKFEDGLLDDDDDLDLRVSWDEAGDSAKERDDSITRMDEDTLGIW